jgi:glycosyltransferase involved in cell wall biosynthesis
METDVGRTTQTILIHETQIPAYIMLKTSSSLLATADHTDSRPVVCHAIHALGVGGAEVLVDQMVRELAPNFRCIVAVLDEVGEIGAQLIQDGFTVEQLHRSPGIDRACAQRLDELVQRENVSLLHAHQHTAFFQSMLSRGLFGSTPVLFTEHGRHFPDVPSFKRSIVNRLLLRKQDRIAGCGGSVQQALIDNEGLPQHRVELVYNGVDLDDLATAPPGARTAIRQEFGFADDDFVAVQVARLHELKDHQTALRAINRDCKECPQIRFLVVGDGEERAAIEAAISGLNLHNNVVLAGSRDDVSSLLAASDAFLLTSISEGTPLTVIQAMAAELPVVSTSVGGLPEMIEDGVSGYLCLAGDDEVLARRLVSLATNSDDCSAIGLAGNVIAHNRFSVDKMLNNYSTMYTEMSH